MSVESKTGAVVENGVIAGNVFDKYNSSNPLVRRMMNGFHASLFGMIENLDGVKDIHEIGCGEGILSLELARRGFNVRGSDFSSEIIKTARANSAASGLDVPFDTRNIYELDPVADGAGLIVCCEVLEHLEDPERALERLAGLRAGHIVLSVPREPLWRGLNMLRGKYLADMGNTPGHLRHWSSARFSELICSYFNVIELRKPLPWTMILAQYR